MQVLNGVITPVLPVYVLVLANRRRVLAAAANGPVFGVLATVCVAVIAVWPRPSFSCTSSGSADVRHSRRPPGPRSARESRRTPQPRSPRRVQLQ
jgi:hypothetical protein